MDNNKITERIKTKLRLLLNVEAKVFKSPKTSKSAQVQSFHRQDKQGISKSPRDNISYSRQLIKYGNVETQGENQYTTTNIFTHYSDCLQQQEQISQKQFLLIQPQRILRIESILNNSQSFHRTQTSHDRVSKQVKANQDWFKGNIRSPKKDVPRFFGSDRNFRQSEGHAENTPKHTFAPLVENLSVITLNMQGNLTQKKNIYDQKLRTNNFQMFKKALQKEKKLVVAKSKRLWSNCLLFNPQVMNPDLGKFKLGKVIKMNKIMPLMVS